jgi:hypothetical protein
MWRTHPPASRCSDDCWAILVFLEPTLNPIFGVCKMLHVLRIGSRKNCRKTPSDVGKSMVSCMEKLPWASWSWLHPHWLESPKAIFHDLPHMLSFDFPHQKTAYFIKADFIKSDVNTLCLTLTLHDPIHRGGFNWFGGCKTQHFMRHTVAAAFQRPKKDWW